MQSIFELNDLISAALTVNNVAVLPQYAVELAEIGSPEAIAARERVLGLIADSHIERTVAFVHHAHSLKMFGRLGDRQGMADTLANLAYVCSAMCGETPSTLRHGWKVQEKPDGFIYPKLSR
ncbi:MAG: hypothetical protein JSS89_11010 [Bacteroidetes bacterium]|nr:hypothetical protein [Bacteroidota bacterium]